MNNKKMWISTISSVAALLVAGSSLAGDMSVPYGWYIDANAGSGKLSNFSAQGSSSQSGTGVNGNIGYKFMPYFAMEAGYTSYASSSIVRNGTKLANVKHNAYGLAGRAIFPIVDSGFELFGKLGVQRISAKVNINAPAAAAAAGLTSSSHDTVGALLGVGAQYYVMPELAITAQWQRAQGNTKTGTEDLYSAGLSYIIS